MPRGGNDGPAKYFKEHPDEYDALQKERAEFLSGAQRKFIDENPERFKEIQMMGTKKSVENRKKNIKKRKKEIRDLAEEYFGKDKK